MKYNITDESITLFENNKTRIINIDEIIFANFFLKIPILMLLEAEWT